MKFRRRRPEDVDINVTSLIDVVLLLLIFFMVSTRFVDHSRINLTLPSSSAKKATTPPADIEVVIGRDGEVAVGGKALVNASVDTVRRALQVAAGDDKDPVIVISADRDTGFQRVVDAMDAARQAGYSHVTFPTKPRASGE